MKRWTLRILLCLTLGMVTTVGVAWYLSVHAVVYRVGELDTVSQGVTSRTPPGWWVYEYIDVGAVRYEYQYLPPDFKWPSTTDVSAIEIIAIPNWVPESDLKDDEIDFYWTFDARGFPLLALWCEPWALGLRGGLDYDAMLSDDDQSAGLGATGDSTPVRVLPLLPILPGFIVNTLFYAAIWFAMFFGFGFVKRTIRRRRGWCLRCGYDLRGNLTNGQDARSTSQDVRSIGCPECGWNRSGVRP